MGEGNLANGTKEAQDRERCEKLVWIAEVRIN